MRAKFRWPLDSLALIDVAVEALHDPGGDQTEEEANSTTFNSRFASYLVGSCIPSLTIQRSVLMPMYMALCGRNVTVSHSTIMLSDGIVDLDTEKSRIRGDYLSISRSHLGTTEKVDFWVGSKSELAVATSTLANVTLEVDGNASIVESNVTGNYFVGLHGNHNHFENSHFGACYGRCMWILGSGQFALVGSSMQTALVVVGNKFSTHLEIRDVEIFDVYTPFLESLGMDAGRTLNQRHLKSCQYSLQILVFTCSVPR